MLVLRIHISNDDVYVFYRMSICFPPLFLLDSTILLSIIYKHSNSSSFSPRYLSSHPATMITNTDINMNMNITVASVTVDEKLFSLKVTVQTEDGVPFLPAVEDFIITAERGILKPVSQSAMALQYLFFILVSVVILKFFLTSLNCYFYLLFYIPPHCNHTPTSVKIALLTASNQHITTLISQPNCNTLFYTLTSHPNITSPSPSIPQPSPYRARGAASLTEVSSTTTPSTSTTCSPRSLTMRAEGAWRSFLRTWRMKEKGESCSVINITMHPRRCSLSDPYPSPVSYVHPVPAPFPFLPSTSAMVLSCSSSHPYSLPYYLSHPCPFPSHILYYQSRGSAQASFLPLGLYTFTATYTESRDALASIPQDMKTVGGLLLLLLLLLLPPQMLMCLWIHIYVCFCLPSL